MAIWLVMSAVHHMACCSAMGGMAPTPGRTKPMKDILVSTGETMLRMVASDAVGYDSSRK